MSEYVEVREKYSKNEIDKNGENVATYFID